MVFCSPASLLWMSLSSIQLYDLNSAPSRIRLCSQILFVNTIYDINTGHTRRDKSHLPPLALTGKTESQQTKFFNTTSYCGPSQLLPIYNKSKGRFLYNPQQRHPLKQKTRFSLMLSDLFLEMMHPVMSKQTPTPRCRGSISFRYAMIQAGATCDGCL
jgi:hypothetical protein